jgi:hypothetical protein
MTANTRLQLRKSLNSRSPLKENMRLTCARFCLWAMPTECAKIFHNLTDKPQVGHSDDGIKVLAFRTSKSGKESNINEAIRARYICTTT